MENLIYLVFVNICVRLVGVLTFLLEMEALFLCYSSVVFAIIFFFFFTGGVGYMYVARIRLVRGSYDMKDVRELCGTRKRLRE